MSLREMAEPPKELGNKFAIVIVPMPIGITDPHRLLRTMRGRMNRIKRSTELGLGEAEQRWNLREFRVDAYMNELFGFINRYLDDTGINEHGGTFVLRDPPQIQWYRPGEGFYAYHIDGAHAHCHRALVFSTYLNDVDEGGGTEFFHQRLVVSAVRGKTAIFPAGLTHLHRGVVSHTREKYLLTGWLSWA